MSPAGFIPWSLGGALKLLVSTLLRRSRLVLVVLALCIVSAVGFAAWELQGFDRVALAVACLVVNGAVLVFAVRIGRAARSAESDYERPWPEVEAGRYLPPRDCQVLVEMGNGEAWKDVKFFRVGAAYVWHDAETLKELDPETVIDWRETETTEVSL